MLSSAEFICLRAAYREAFWEELKGAFDTAAIAVLSTCNIFPQLTVASWFAVFKVSCFPFLNCFASFLLNIIFLPALSSRTVYSLLLHLDPREKISSPIQDLSCSRKPLTYPGSASVQCGLHRRTEYRESTKHGPLVHGPPPWTGSIKIRTGSMDPLFLQVEVAPYATI